MTEYYKHGVNLSDGQKNKISSAYKKGITISIKLSNKNLTGNDILALTQTQINKIKNAQNGVQLNLSIAQLKYMEKKGGFLPLLIPIITGALAAAGGLTGGIASAVSSAKSNTEQARHNRAIEELTKESLKSGTGVVSDAVGMVPVIGNYLKPLLQKIGLGINDSKKICNGGCVCKNKLRYKQIGRGLYIEPATQGAGLFLGPWKE